MPCIPHSCRRFSGARASPKVKTSVCDSRGYQEFQCKDVRARRGNFDERHTDNSSHIGKAVRVYQTRPPSLAIRVDLCYADGWIESSAITAVTIAKILFMSSIYKAADQVIELLLFSLCRCLPMGAFCCCFDALMRSKVSRAQDISAKCAGSSSEGARAASIQGKKAAKLNRITQPRSSSVVLFLGCFIPCFVSRRLYPFVDVSLFFLDSFCSRTAVVIIDFPQSQLVASDRSKDVSTL